MSAEIRILLLADTHLGFDLPNRPRVARRRRGHDFLANYASALGPALAGEVDIVVHGGDVFDRPDVAPSLAYQALEPLARIADRGVPVFVVPGNHERSRVPHHRFASHPNVHEFDRPRTVVVEVRGTTVALTGFPFERRDVRTRLADLLERSEWTGTAATHRLLCVHQCVEGATVGPGNYTFRSAADVIRTRDVPADFAAVLSGHIHRHQVITTDLRQRPLATPVLYPGSIERTSLAEIGERKGYMIVRLSGGDGGTQLRWEFRDLPARPMMVKELIAERMTPESLEAAVRDLVGGAPPDAVLRIRVVGDVTGARLRVLSAARVRAYAPESMNVEIVAGDSVQRVRAARAAGSGGRRRSQQGTGQSPQLELGGV